MNWICCQRGAREHYAVPRALYTASKLECLMTEFYVPRWLAWLGRNVQGGMIARMISRCHHQLKNSRIKSWNCQALVRSLRDNGANRYEYYLRENGWIAGKWLSWLKKNVNPLGKVFFSYSGTALEIFRWAKENGGFTVLGVIDPGRVEQEMVREESRMWPGWELRQDEVPEEYNNVRDAECELADIVVVNSEWSRKALIQQGVPSGKITVVPLCYEEEVVTGGGEICKSGDVIDKQGREFSVLFLGQVILRKGIQYLVEAARQPELSQVRFNVVGPIGISDEAIRSAPSNVKFHGPVNRLEATKWYRQSDLFVLSTISDGFAITQIEAMANGLPVIATPNCGEVVRDGVDGLIVPIRDAQALAGAIWRFVEDRGFHERCRREALKRCREFSLQHLQNRLIELEEHLRN